MIESSEDLFVTGVVAGFIIGRGGEIGAEELDRAMDAADDTWGRLMKEDAIPFEFTLAGMEAAKRCL